MKINFGCGPIKKDGYVNVDWNPRLKPDVLHNLNTFPYPFPDDSAERIESHHVIEHLDRPFEVMKEFHRILKSGGTLNIAVPHFSRGFTHAEHEHGFDVSFPYYFNGDLFPEKLYYDVNFRLVSMNLHWLCGITLHYLPQLGIGSVATFFLQIANAVFSFLANLNQMLCSRIWCFWVGGFEEIEFEFECIK